MAVVRTGGVLETVSRPWSPLRAFSVALHDGAYVDYATLYRTQPNVRTVVDFLARNVAQLGLKTFRRRGDSEREHLTDHPLAQSLRAPNPQTTPYRWKFQLVADVGVFDEYYALKVRANNGRIALLRVPPQRIRLEGDNWLEPTAYTVVGGLREVTFPAAQMFRIRGHNPDDPRSGLSPLETLRRLLSEESAAGTYREQFWRNAATVGGVIQRPLDAPPWGDLARRRFREDWQARFAGPDNAGQTPVLEEGMTFQTAAFDAQQSQYVEARKLSREEVAAAYHIPPPMVGILDHATFSNVEQQHRMLYQDTLAPWLTMIEEEIEAQLLPEFDDTDRVYVEFNLSEKLKGSFEEEARALQTATGAPWLLRNEARAMRNLAPVEGGDELVTPLNVIVGGQASPTDSVPAERDGRSADVIREVVAACWERQRSAVMRRLGGRRGPVKVSDIFNVHRWDEELAEDLVAAGLGEDEALRKAVEVNRRTAEELRFALDVPEPKTAVAAVFDDPPTLERLGRSRPPALTVPDEEAARA